jgi:hypothetical protein
MSGAAGVAGPCAVSQDRWWWVPWIVVHGVWLLVGPVVVSLALGCGLGWLLGWMGHVLCPGTGGSSGYGLLSVVCDVWWLVSAGWGGRGCHCELGFCDVAAQVGSVEVWWVHMNNAPCGSPPVGSPLSSLAPSCVLHTSHPSRGGGSGGSGVLFIVFKTCQATKS